MKASELFQSQAYLTPQLPFHATAEPQDAKGQTIKFPAFPLPFSGYGGLALTVSFWGHLPGLWADPYLS